MDKHERAEYSAKLIKKGMGSLFRLALNMSKKCGITIVEATRLIKEELKKNKDD